MSGPTLTQQLTELITDKPVAATDLEQAALLTLDAMANALGARTTEPGAILLRWADETTIADAARRALLGSLTHILETDDLHRTSVVHPGCVVGAGGLGGGGAGRHSRPCHAEGGVVGIRGGDASGDGGWSDPLSALAQHRHPRSLWFGHGCGGVVAAGSAGHGPRPG